MLLSGIEERVVHFFEENFGAGYEVRVANDDVREVVRQLEDAGSIDVLVIPRSFDKHVKVLAGHVKPGQQYVLVTTPGGWCDTKAFEDALPSPQFIITDFLDQNRYGIKHAINGFLLQKVLRNALGGKVVISPADQVRPSLEECANRLAAATKTQLLWAQSVVENNGKESDVRISIAENAEYDYDGHVFTLAQKDFQEMVSLIEGPTIPRLPSKIRERLLYIGRDDGVIELIRELARDYEVKIANTLYDGEYELRNLPRVVLHSIVNAKELELADKIGWLRRKESVGDALRYVPIVIQETGRSSGNDARMVEAAVYSIALGSDSIIRSLDEIPSILNDVARSQELRSLEEKWMLNCLAEKYQGIPAEEIELLKTADFDAECELARREFLSPDAEDVGFQQLRNGNRRMVRVIQGSAGAVPVKLYKALVNALNSEKLDALRFGARAAIEKAGDATRKDQVTALIRDLESQHLVRRDYPWRLGVMRIPAGEETYFIKEGNRKDILTYVHHHNFFERLHRRGVSFPVSNLAYFLKQPGLIVEIQEKGASDLQNRLEQAVSSKDSKVLDTLLSHCIKAIAHSSALGPSIGKESLYEQGAKLEDFLNNRYLGRMEQVHKFLETAGVSCDPRIVTQLMRSHSELQQPLFALPKGYFCDWVPTNAGIANDAVYRFDFVKARRGVPFFTDLATFFQLGTVMLSSAEAERVLLDFVCQYNAAIAAFNSKFGLSPQKTELDEQIKRQLVLDEVDFDIEKVREFRSRGVPSYQGLEASLNDLNDYIEEHFFFRPVLLRKIKADFERPNMSMGQLWEKWYKARNPDAVDYLSFTGFFADNIRYHQPIDDSPEVIQASYVPQFWNQMRSRAEYSLLSYVDSVLNERAFLEKYPENRKERIRLILQQAQMAVHCTQQYAALNSHVRPAAESHMGALMYLKNALETAAQKLG